MTLSWRSRRYWCFWVVHFPAAQQRMVNCIIEHCSFSCYQFVCEHFAGNRVTLWPAVEKLQRIKVCAVFLDHRVVVKCVSDFKDLSKRQRNTTTQLQLDELCTLVETLNNWTVVDRVHAYIDYSSCLPLYNWMALWKNRICSTTMKLRKSLVKPVMWQNISSCLVLPPEIVMHNAFNVILWTSADICVVVHDDLGWKNWTTQYNYRFSAASLALQVIFVHRKHLPIYASCMTISGGRTKQVICFGELAAVD